MRESYFVRIKKGNVSKYLQTSLSYFANLPPSYISLRYIYLSLRKPFENQSKPSCPNPLGINNWLRVIPYHRFGYLKLQYNNMMGKFITKQCGLDEKVGWLANTQSFGKRPPHNLFDNLGISDRCGFDRFSYKNFLTKRFVETLPLGNRSRKSRQPYRF